MDSSAITAAGNVALDRDSLQTNVRVLTGTGAAGAATTATFGADGSAQVASVHASSPVDAATSFGDDISLSSFLWAFKTGDKLELDGPMMFNGNATVKRLDKDCLQLAMTGAMGTGTVTVERKKDNTFTVSVNLGKKPFKMEMTAAKSGSKLVFTDRWNPDTKLIFSRDGATVNLDPEGMKIPGSIDISKK